MRRKAIYDPEIGNFGDALIFFRFHFYHWGKNGSHGVVYPYIDGAQFFFNPLSSLLNSVRVSYINRDGQCF